MLFRSYGEDGELVLNIPFNFVEDSGLVGTFANYLDSTIRSVFVVQKGDRDVEVFAADKADAEVDFRREEAIKDSGCRIM